MGKRGRPQKAGSQNHSPRDGVTPEILQAVLEKVRGLCEIYSAGVTCTEVTCALPHGNAQVFYSLKKLATEGELVEQRGARSDLHSNSMCFRPVKESTT